MLQNKCWNGKMNETVSDVKTAMFVITDPRTIKRKKAKASDFDITSWKPFVDWCHEKFKMTKINKKLKMADCFKTFKFIETHSSPIKRFKS